MIGTIDPTPYVDYNDEVVFLLSRLETYDDPPVLDNRYESQWILREGRKLNIKPPVQTHVIKMRFKRKRIRCNRRGMGLRLRKDTKI